MSLGLMEVVPKYLEHQREGKWRPVKGMTDDSVGQRV